jgi:hypothetical protein
MSRIRKETSSVVKPKKTTLLVIERQNQVSALFYVPLLEIVYNIFLCPISSILLIIQAYVGTRYLKFPFRRWSSGIDPLISLNSRV